MDIFDRVRMLASIEGISLSTLEQTLGFSNKSLYPHKKDSTIRGDRVVALAKHFHVTTDYLLTGENGGEYLTLNDEERYIVDCYRMLNNEGHTALLGVVKSFADMAIYKKSDSAEELAE